MADTRCQLDCENWVREKWMRREFGQPFNRERLRLKSGGLFEFDAVSADKTIVANISTSGACTASGKRAVGKMMKLRSDMLFLMLSKARRKVMVFCELDMFELCRREHERGRTPKEIEFFHAPLPARLTTKLHAARKIGSDEVSPRKLSASGPLRHS